jgi:hypothetical protein
LATPLPEVLDSFEPLTGLWELEDRVVVIDLRGDILVLARVLPVPLEGSLQPGLVQDGIASLLEEA